MKETAMELMLRLSLIQADLEQIAQDDSVAWEVARACAHAAMALEHVRMTAEVLDSWNKEAN